MNADLMITIAFCVYVVLGSLAIVALAPRKLPDDQDDEADRKRLDAGIGPQDAIGEPKPTKAADQSDTRALQRVGDLDRSLLVKRAAPRPSPVRAGETAEAGHLGLAVSATIVHRDEAEA
jgi:hypothetical protein